MLIGELASKCGMTKDTIRFYEKRGLITLKNNHRRDNSYKEYSQHIHDKLLLIRELKNLGFTLTEIDKFLRLWTEDDASCSKIRFVLENKIAEVGDQIKKLTDLKESLSVSLGKCANNACEFEKTVPSLVR
jgi:DNA-binding transcriptional MerR regulator